MRRDMRKTIWIKCNNIKKFSKLYDYLPFYLKNGFIYEHKLYKIHIDSITKNIEYWLMKKGY